MCIRDRFNSDESLTKLVYLVYKDISRKWQKSISNWSEIISQFAIIFDKRLEKYL
jgi:putative transposase